MILSRIPSTKLEIAVFGCQTICRHTDMPKDDVPTERFVERRFADKVKTMYRQFNSTTLFTAMR